MSKAYIGIDLCFAKRKRLPISICTWRNGRLIPEALKKLPIEPPRGSGNAAVLDHDLVQSFTRQATSYITKACQMLSLTPWRIAIDAPSGPRSEGTHRRAAESAMDKEGISCFTTPSASQFEVIFEKVRRHLENGGPENRIPHANQLWMFVGFQLFEELNRIAQCIEVFPQATARVMGSGQIHKSSSGGVKAQLAAVARHTGWPSDGTDEADFVDIAFAPAHDRLDAYLSAWVAALDESDRVAFGSPPDDVIWAPRIGDGVYQAPVTTTRPGTETARKKKSPSADHTFSRDCPACGFKFKRWPFGWDSHAVHTCTGLRSKEAGGRKAEYKRRFKRLFK